MNEQHQDYQCVWRQVANQFQTGDIVSERGLQAALYARLVTSFPLKAVIVEPYWQCNGQPVIPDMIVVEDNRITEIFEIKFVPHGYPVFEPDLRKLCSYGRSPEEKYYSKLDPDTGRWKTSLPVDTHCARHLVAVGREDAAAVWPESIGAALEQHTVHTIPVNHWFGRVGQAVEKGWDIDFDIGGG